MEKTLKKIGLNLLILTLFLALAPTAWAAPTETALPISEKIPEEKFLSHTGIVQEIRPYYDGQNRPVPGRNYILIETETGSQINFFTDEESHWLSEEEVAVGDTLTGFYNAALPVIMIYPPQYHAVVIGANLPQEQFIKVGRFDENLLSIDGELKLNLGEDTEIIWPEGEEGDADQLANRLLAVIYGPATKSLPPQTTPDTIFVLKEKASLPWDDEDKDYLEEIYREIPHYEYLINDERISAPPAYVDGEGQIMLPLRAIAQALGHTVHWESGSGQISINHHLMLAPGKDSYPAPNGQALSLGAGPDIRQGITYVPMKFFSQILGMNNAYAFEGQIVIDNHEKME